MTDLLIFFRPNKIYRMFELNILPLHQFVWQYVSNGSIVDCRDKTTIYEMRLYDQKTMQTASINSLKRTKPQNCVIRITVGRLFFSSLGMF